MRLLAVKFDLFGRLQTEEKRLLNKVLVHCPMAFCVAGLHTPGISGLHKLRIYRCLVVVGYYRVL